MLIDGGVAKGLELLFFHIPLGDPPIATAIEVMQIDNGVITPLLLVCLWHGGDEIGEFFYLGDEEFFFFTMHKIIDDGKLARVDKVCEIRHGNGIA